MRTANAALEGYRRSLVVAFRSGAVAGMVTVGIGLMGASLIVDPLGRELAFVDDEVGVAAATIDRAEVVRVRAVNPALALRRFRVEPA